MSRVTEVAVDLRYERRPDGRIHIHSPDVPGLHLTGTDITALRDEVEGAMRLLLRGNAKLAVDRIRYVPNVETLADHFRQVPERETYLVSLKQPQD